MITIALRFADFRAPSDGTISEHEKLIEEFGFVWYGKFGSGISKKIQDEIMSSEKPKILLIQSGKFHRYWAEVSEISGSTPDLKYVPTYYHDLSLKIKAWFKITKFSEAPNNIMSKCLVASSGNVLSEVSKRSDSPYFVISTSE